MKLKTGIALVALAVSSTLVLSACKLGSKKTVPLSERKVKVVSTIGMINDVVKNIGGARVTAVSLMGPGVDPHLYRASEGDVRKLSTADIVFYNGLHLESKMGEILEKMSSRKTTVALANSIDKSKLLSPPEFDGLNDPHVWFDIRLWVEVAESVKDALVKLDPTHGAIYKKQAKDYISRLQILHQNVSELSKQIPSNQRVLVTAHDAFNYFGRTYDFEVVGLQGISTESEAGIKDVQQLANFIVDRKIPAIFIESSIPKRNIEAVQQAVRAKGWDVKIGGELFSDAMGDAGTLEGTYIGMVKHNVFTIVSSLSGTSVATLEKQFKESL